MNIKSILPTIIIGASTPFIHSCKQAAKPAEKIIQTASSKLENNAKMQQILKDSLSLKMTDKEKVIEYNKLLNSNGLSNGNYVLIDKKGCKAYVYSPDGDVLLTSEVALGRQKGDVRGGGYKNKSVKQTFTTPPGEFYIGREGAISGTTDEKLYGKRVLMLRGDHTRQDSKKTQTLALHRVPATPMGRLRENVFHNGTLKDNRVSFGCVNFLVDSFDKMRKLIKGKGTKVYILPEEKGNHLKLEKQKDGSYKFFQTKYRYESQETK
mgnify:CR=1 FL=1